MPEIPEIVAMEKTLRPEIEFVGYEDKGDELLWDFDYIYRASQTFRVRIKTDRKGTILNAASV